jgi:hypothetical protein
MPPLRRIPLADMAREPKPVKWDLGQKSLGVHYDDPSPERVAQLQKLFSPNSAISKP